MKLLGVTRNTSCHTLEPERYGLRYLGMMRLLAQLCSSQKTWDGPTIPTNQTKRFNANRHSGRNIDVRASLRAPVKTDVCEDCAL